MTTTSGITKRTRRAIYDLIREHGTATQNEIAAALEISLPTVTKYLRHLIEAGLVEQGPKLSSGSNGGRSPISYACVPDGRFAVGVDITRDRITCLVTNLDRGVVTLRQAHRDFDRSDEYFEFVGREVMAMIDEAGIDKARILGVGVAVPGLINEATGQVTYGRVIDNHGITAAGFARHLPFPTRLVHDSDAAGLAEFWPRETVENAFYISLSKSVGGSVRVNDVLYRGDGEFAGEIGHLRIHEGGLRCYCGQFGCVDAYCNAGVLSQQADGSLDDFFARLSEGGPAEVDVWDRYTSDLALAIHNVRVLFGCAIILGGDVGARIHDYMDDLRSKVDGLSFLASHSETFLVPCTYTTQPVATGAALSFVDEFRQDLGPAQGGRDGAKRVGASGRTFRRARSQRTQLGA